MPKRFPSGFLVAVLLTASRLLWAVMFFGPLAHLSRLSDGMTPFDIAPWGYSYAEARGFLEAIGAPTNREKVYRISLSNCTASLWHKANVPRRPP
jgi:hypothetical protein